MHDVQYKWMRSECVCECIHLYLMGIFVFYFPYTSLWKYFSTNCANYPAWILQKANKFMTLALHQLIYPVNWVLKGHNLDKYDKI